MAKMSEHELVAIVNSAEQEAAIYNGELSSLNTRLMKDYLQDPYGDEIDDRSQVISPDVQDVVESDLPSLARIFLGSKQPLVFEANTDAELEEVEEKNKYVHHLVMEQPNSYSTLLNWMKEALIINGSAIKYFMEDTRKTKEVAYENLDEMELLALFDSLPDDAELIDQSSNEDGTFNVRFKLTEGKQRFRMINVPPESFLISRNAATLEDAELVGDAVERTRGELIAEGYDRDLVAMLPSAEEQDDEIETLRNSTQGGDSEASHWANEKVELRDLYMKLDYDGDGIAERRHILKAGNHILINEAFDHVPYATLSCVSMPHQVIGRSRAALTQQTQRIKTVVLRQTLDNMYMVNNPRNVVHPDVNIDDLLNVRPNGIVRMKRNADLPPQNAIFPLITPYVGDKSLQVMQYLDHVRAQSTGTLMASQGLDGDSIKEETATRFEGVQEDAKAKIELVARTFAETGFRKLYEGCAWMVSQYQDSEAEIRVLGRPLKVNPANWKYDHCVATKVGTGASDIDKTIGAMQGIFAIQQQLMQMGSPMVDQVKLYNSLSELTEALGLRQSDKYFNNPEQEQELLQAKVEIYERKLMEAQQMLQQMQNPLADAEMIKQKAMLTKAQSDAQIKVAELSEKSRQFDEQLRQKDSQYQQDLAMKLTELEAKFNQQLDAEFASNALVYNPETGTFSGQI